MTQAVAKTAVAKTAVAKPALTGCLAPIDKKGLDELIAKGKAQGHQDAEMQDRGRGPFPPPQFYSQPAGLRGRRAPGAAR